MSAYLSVSIFVSFVSSVLWGSINLSVSSASFRLCILFRSRLLALLLRNFFSLVTVSGLLTRVLFIRLFGFSSTFVWFSSSLVDSSPIIEPSVDDTDIFRFPLQVICHKYSCVFLNPSVCLYWFDTVACATFIPWTVSGGGACDSNPFKCPFTRCIITANQIARHLTITVGSRVVDEIILNRPPCGFYFNLILKNKLFYSSHSLRTIKIAHIFPAFNFLLLARYQLEYA